MSLPDRDYQTSKLSKAKAAIRKLKAGSSPLEAASKGNDATWQPGLYVVATPIGNLKDISSRALFALKAADVIACEDTRRTGRLLQAFEIKTKLVAYHDHSTAKDRDRLLNAIADGQIVVLVSDAGTPCIADPGFKLVRAAHELQLPVIPIPGPNAAITALSVAGLPTDRFLFEGFLPNKTFARKQRLNAVKNLDATLVFYETGPRLEAMLTDAITELGNRPCAILRELTKIYETVKLTDLVSILDELANGEPRKGEIVVLIGGASGSKEWEQSAIDGLLLEQSATKPPKQAARVIAEETGLPTKTLYARLLKLKKSETN